MGEIDGDNGVTLIIRGIMMVEFIMISDCPSLRIVEAKKAGFHKVYDVIIESRVLKSY